MGCKDVSNTWILLVTMYLVINSEEWESGGCCVYHCYEYGVDHVYCVPNGGRRLHTTLEPFVRSWCARISTSIWGYIHCNIHTSHHFLRFHDNWNQHLDARFHSAVVGVDGIHHPVPTAVWTLAYRRILYLFGCNIRCIYRFYLDGIQYLLLALRFLAIPNNIGHAIAKHRDIGRILKPMFTQAFDVRLQLLS